MSFELHHRLAEDCFDLGALALSQALLMNDSRFPWVILVPRIEGLRDLHEVPDAHRMALFDEIDRASRALLSLTGATKMNVAALGNQVPQLHVHVIARTSEDAAWPGPVWVAGPGTPYDGEPALAQQLRAALDL